MVHFRLTPVAKQSLREIAMQTQAKWGKTQRTKYIRQLDAGFHELAKHPHMGRSRQDIAPELRSCPVGKHVVFYHTHKNGITIADILHQHMDPALHL